MTPSPEFDNLLVSPRGIAREARVRLSSYLSKTVARRDIPLYEQEGWVVDKHLKRTVRMRMRKQHDTAFRDRVWAAFARLQFSTMSRGDGIAFGIARSDPEHHISVLAADDEVVLAISCVSFEENKHAHLKPEISALRDVREDLIKTLRREFPGRKIKQVLASNNVDLSSSARAALDDADIVHLDEQTVDYFLLLAEHLGKAARFQLLGSLFAGQRIPALDPMVHAIRGRMGGLTYYSFTIEPERLLKIAYVLHRNRANSDLMPTYQRLIKRSRLQAVSRFVNSGGFFPNSLVLNLETGRNLRFDAITKAGDGPVLGTLYLPQTYRSAYVIDGQHRLYGYANSERAASETIPVVAFVNLPRSEQVRIFMQINENQQAVPKNLRNTLNSDLLWDSSDLRERSRALKLRIAQHLGESKSSPLFGRVILGETTRTTTRCLTIDAINNGLTRGNFIGSFTKTVVKEAGTFYLGASDATFKKIVPFLERCLSHIRTGLPAQWAIGGGEGGFVFINIGVESLLRIVSDIVDHVVMARGVDPRRSDADGLYRESAVYLDAVVGHLRTLGGEQAAEYRRMYGSGAGARYWRRLQAAIREVHPEFDPPGLSAFLEDEAKAFNTESFEMIREIETFLNKDVRRRLEDKFGGAMWFRQGVPRKVRESSMQLAAAKNVDLDPDEQVDRWDCLHLIDYHAIITQSQEIWTELFAHRYAWPRGQARSGSWKSRASWLVELNRIRNENAHTYTVKPDEYDFLIGLVTGLVRDAADDE